MPLISVDGFDDVAHGESTIALSFLRDTSQ